MRQWQSLFPSVIYVRDSITPSFSALFKSFKKYLKSFFFVLWKRDDFTRSPGRQRERTRDLLLWSAGASWSVVMSHRVVGRGGLKENVLLYVMTAGWLDQSKAWSTQCGPCVRTCVCVCVYAWRCVTSPSLHCWHLFIWNKGERTVWGQCLGQNFNFRYLYVFNTTKIGM